MSISSRPVREKKNTQWNLDHVKLVLSKIQLELLTLERNECRKNKAANNQNQHYGKILCSFISKINQNYLKSLRKKESQSIHSQDQQNQINGEKCTNVYFDSGNKKYYLKGDSDSKKQSKTEVSKRKYQYKKPSQTGSTNTAQSKGEEKRKVRSTQMNQNGWYKLYLKSKNPEIKSKQMKNSYSHVFVAYRIHFDQSKEKSLEENDPTYHAKRLKNETFHKMDEES